MRDRTSTNGDPPKPVTTTNSIMSQFFERPHSVYVLALITVCYSSNQLNRYILTSVSEGLEEGIGFGDGDGESFLYGILVGPTTTLPFCIGMVVAGHLADQYQAWKVREWRSQRIFTFPFVCFYHTLMFISRAFYMNNYIGLRDSEARVCMVKAGSVFRHRSEWQIMHDVKVLSLPAERRNEMMMLFFFH